ncbi:Fe2+-enterobactin ABC transporter substrate-binding protein [Mycetocola reblochoni]|uniref:Ferric enterobactin-binding periplasmic protein FepB (TC 3.A.1.14.2) n=2 Tax=Mycetocola reblochoni TaxID=331618 RepID=A0A1R4JWP7_9MICO|nr:Fe2+-enterobactin ABC transporter substrate-binding protein [Mycetocola reblochoni]RLP70628.1 Fe2+-enterobactin ABC transporter substrate-binding protein [Mycetocola reblochoni]SJN36399.1 Ferric enterobactin-binding periplasmic protein FepB (TC 3.A.1.14.2) [Mycetocola reblochoni REB411]
MTRRRGLIATAIAASALLLTGCASGASDTATESAAAEGDWPRTITHELGETTLDAQPERIVSTSVTATGTLLAIDAPVVASAATTPSDITDDVGFFSQWSDVAEERGVEVLYPDLTLDLEAVIAADPDLIVISTAGADSTADQYEALSDIAPTVAVDYSSKDWQDLAAELGESTGHEADATALVEDFDATTAAAAEELAQPEGTSSIVSFNGAGQDAGIAKEGGSHATLLDALGFDVVEADASLDTSEQARGDFAFVSFENLPKAIEGDSVFLISSTEDTVAQFLDEPVLQNLPAVTDAQVYTLGETSFRIDYYSALEIIDQLRAQLG